MIAFLAAAALSANGAVTSPAAPAPSSTPAPSQSFSAGPTQPFIPWNQPVINSSPWDRPDIGLVEVDPRQRWVMFLDENPLAHRYIPPTPPALAETVPLREISLPPKFQEGLLDFVSEPFYMAYGQMLDSRLLSEARAERISRYRAARDQLVAELRTFLEQSKQLPEPRRTESLHEFSSAHTSRAAAIESEADAIRVDLTSPGFFRFGASAYDLARSADWSREASGPGSFAYILPLLGAQFYAGFSADQRLLLHEMTMEQRAGARPPAASDTPATDYLFFIPSTARIKLPADLPATVADKIQRFSAQKDLIKAELQNALDRHQFKFPGSRTEHFHQLAHSQAPAFAALHHLAEDIRRELAGIHYPDAPAATPLPAGLTERVGRATSEKAALQRELLARFKALQSQFPGERVEIVRRNQGLALTVTGTPSQRRSHEDRAFFLAEIEDFNASIGQRYADLAQEMDALRRDLSELAPASEQASTKDVNRLAAEFDRSYKKQQTWQRYRDYHAAVLMPGLSPELRRLLYRAAWTDLFKQQVLAAP